MTLRLLLVGAFASGDIPPPPPSAQAGADAVDARHGAVRRRRGAHARPFRLIRAGRGRRFQHAYDLPSGLGESGRALSFDRFSASRSNAFIAPGHVDVSEGRHVRTRNSFQMSSGLRLCGGSRSVDSESVARDE